MNDDFISEDDLSTFEGFLKYQAVDPATLTSDELAMWRSFFDDAAQRRESSPKVGLMKLRPAEAGEQRYGVALRDGFRESACELSPRRDLAQQKLWQSSLPEEASTVNSGLHRERASRNVHGPR